MNEILSTQNARVKQWRKLKQAKYRLEQGLFVAEGIKLSKEALLHTDATVLIIESNSAEDFSELIGLAQNKKCEIVLANKPVIESLCETKTPQLSLVISKIPNNKTITYEKNAVFLENVSDPGNVGAIIRTADAAGIATVVLSQSCANLYSPKVIRSSMGSVFHVDAMQTVGFYEELRSFVDCGFNVIAGSLDGNSQLPKGKNCILVGNEGKGLTNRALDICTHPYKIPMPGFAESLNVAVAASLMIYKANEII